MENQTKDQLVLETYQSLRPRLSDYLDHWAKVDPKGTALIDAANGEHISWKTFSMISKAFAAELLAMGIKRGDVVATTLPLLKEHVYLMFACFRLGVTIAPLDLRLREEEIDRSLNKIKPKAYFFVGHTPVVDFRPILKPVIEKHRARIPHWIQFQETSDGILPGAVWVDTWAKKIKRHFLTSMVTGSRRRAEKLVDKRDSAAIIFTTGSTGEPKPALLSHEAILVQCLSLAVAFEATRQERILVNLPPSHVACLTEELATAVYCGAVSVLLKVFKADDSLAAIEKYKCTMLGQVPAQYNMEWRLPNFEKYDLSSLRMAIYGGQSVSAEFLGKLAKMTKRIGTGLGMTETAGFNTYTPIDATAEDINVSLGFDSPLCPISIRKPMKEDGTAGPEVPAGEVGEICFSGPQVFSGYLHDPENTRRTLTSDGILYSGDVGSYDETGLHLSGRRKQIIKPKGYQVFPAEVENFLATRLGERAAMVAVIGVHHEVFSEAILAFVETRDGHQVTSKEVQDIAKGLAAYARPSHIEVLPAGSLPLNRVGKTDYLILKEKGDAIVAQLRQRGGWDQAPSRE